MSKDESRPSSDISASKPEERPLPSAWQPLTPRGVAAFSRASIGRLFLVQFIIALLAVGSVIWFLATILFPTVREAIRQLPDTGLIQDQQLSSPRTVTVPLVENQFLTFVVDVDGTGTPSLASDLSIEFHRRNFALCSLLGCLWLDYPRGSTVQFNRPELESWWAAWELTIYSAVGLGVVIVLFVNWLMLATLYCPVARIYAFFKDRQLTLLGSWKLAATALLPGALLTAAGVVLYGLGLVSLIQFLLLWVLHLIVGWVYLFVSPLRLPRASDAASVPRDPFARPKPASANPFSTPKND
jgi:hypothetical protein